MSRQGRRLIEDYLPIGEVGTEASREKSVRKGHISTLHLWWARRPLVACRAAIFAALIPAEFWLSDATPGKTLGEEKRREIDRPVIRDYLTRLCKYPGNQTAIAQAEQHILEAHARKLSEDLKEPVTVESIRAGKHPRPRVLDMFAGGGSIPLEALRLGCETHALDLNPVAHIVELCTLVYPQKFGQPDATAPGCAKDGTWAGLAKEVEHWGKRILTQVKTEIDDLYPPIPDPDAPPQLMSGESFLPGMEPDDQLRVPGGYLTPVAYLWTRTVPCKNKKCGATVPLARQAWLCKRKGRYLALKAIAPKGEKRVRYNLFQATTVADLGFDPSSASTGGNATCPFCGAVADSKYVQAIGKESGLGQQLMAVICTKPNGKGKRYFPASEVEDFCGPSEDNIRLRIEALAQASNLSVPSEAINPLRL